MNTHLTAEISLSALGYNIRLLRQQVPAGTKLCAVVKADCYGHGVAGLWPAIAAAVDCLAVAAPVEALQLRQLGYAGPLLVFFSAFSHGPQDKAAQILECMLREDIEVTVADMQAANMADSIAGKLGTTAQVHVKIDSGMGRSGVAHGDAAELVKEIGGLKNVKLSGLYTHFASADEADKSASYKQIEEFMSAVDACDTDGGVIVHACNSAGTIDLPEAHFNMVRIGIAMYGYQPSDEMLNHLDLRPILRLRGSLMQVKDVAAGSSCGYGLKHTFVAPSRVGLVPVGYADGYRRSLSERGVMKIRGQMAGVCGRVSMDQTIVDVTSIEGVSVGDDVEIISPNPADPHSVENLAKLADTIPYEITCGLGGRVERVVVKEFSDVAGG